MDWLAWLIQKEQDLKCSLNCQKSSCSMQKELCPKGLVRRYKQRDGLRWLHVNPIQANFTRICMESSEQTSAYIYRANCTNRLIFVKGALFTLFFLKMLTNPIISQICIFVTSHFSSLLPHHFMYKLYVTYRLSQLYDTMHCVQSNLH